MAEVRRYVAPETDKVPCFCIGIETVTRMGSSDEYRMHSGISGVLNTATYHHDNGTTIIVSQREVERVADWRGGDITPGVKPRNFKFAGKKENIEAIVDELKEVGLELTECKPSEKEAS